jgi:hypothetical protein
VCFAEIDFALGARWIAKTVRRMSGRKKSARTLERPAE